MDVGWLPSFLVTLHKSFPLLGGGRGWEGVFSFLVCKIKKSNQVILYLKEPFLLRQPMILSLQFAPHLMTQFVKDPLTVGRLLGAVIRRLVCRRGHRCPWAGSACPLAVSSWGRSRLH